MGGPPVAVVTPWGMEIGRKPVSESSQIISQQSRRGRRRQVAQVCGYLPSAA